MVMRSDGYRRAVVAVGIGVLAAVLCFVQLRAVPERAAADFTWAVRAAEALIEGRNPYADPLLGREHPYPNDAPLFYPLPAVWLGLPFVFMPRALAGALFFGVSSGLLAWGLSRDGYGRLALFLSAPYWFALLTVQWSPLITAAALIAPLLPVVLAKPNIGLPVLLLYGSRRGLIGCAVVLLFSLLVFPSWPRQWLANLDRHTNYVPALLFPPLLLALLKWRDKRAQLLVTMALIPQRLLYDMVAVGLVTTSAREALVYAAITWIAFVGGLMFPEQAQYWVVVFVYVPAFVIVLRPLGGRRGWLRRLPWADAA